MKEKNDLPRWARLCAEYKRKRERPDNDAKEVKGNESEHSDYGKRGRGVPE